MSNAPPPGDPENLKRRMKGPDAAPGETSEAASVDSDSTEPSDSGLTPDAGTDTPPTEDNGAGSDQDR